MDITAKRVLVTGASGFIGSHLTERLVNTGCDVRALVHYNSQNSWGNLAFLDEKVLDKIEVILGDIRDPFMMRQVVGGCDVVFHLAALIAIPYSYVAPSSYVDTNILGTMNVMQACLDGKVSKVIHTSTSEVYGTAQYTPIDENHPLQGQSPYSASKIGADKMVESFHRSFDLPVATVRPFNTFGPRQSSRAIIPTIVGQALFQKEVRLGALDPVRDMTFVKDTVRGLIMAAESESTIGRTLNLGTGTSLTIGELAAAIQDCMDKKVEIVSDPSRRRPPRSEVMNLISDNRAARNVMNWAPEVSLRDGLLETIEFMKRHPGLYKTDRYVI